MPSCRVEKHFFPGPAKTAGTGTSGAQRRTDRTDEPQNVIRQFSNRIVALFAGHQKASDFLIGGTAFDQ